LDCLHWHLPTQALKDETSDASPGGIPKHLFIHTTTMIIDLQDIQESINQYIIKPSKIKQPAAK
jgi:hypothetical protein